MKKNIIKRRESCLVSMLKFVWSFEAECKAVRRGGVLDVVVKFNILPPSHLPSQLFTQIGVKFKLISAICLNPQQLEVQI